MSGGRREDGTARGPRPGPSRYEQFGTAEREPEHWVTVAQSDPVTGELRWLPGWERRAAGWQPLDELLRGRRW